MNVAYIVMFMAYDIFGTLLALVRGSLQRLAVFIRGSPINRYSTEDRQNPATSYPWQHDQADATITAEGRIKSRRVPSLCTGANLLRRAAFSRRHALRRKSATPDRGVLSASSTARTTPCSTGGPGCRSSSARVIFRSSTGQRATAI